MKIDEAIKHLDECMSETDKMLWPECLEAHKLGIEALKAIKHQRDAYNYYIPKLLPGEDPPEPKTHAIETLVKIRESPLGKEPK